MSLPQTAIRTLLLLLPALVLTACASAPVPDMAFYRMPSLPDRAPAADAEPR